MTYYKKTEDTRCHVARKFGILDGKWNLMLICALYDEAPVRHGELKKRMNNISDAALSNALRSLMKDGIIERFAYNEIPPRVEYSLTETGRSLYEIVKSECTWINECYGINSYNDGYCWKFGHSKEENQ